MTASESLALSLRVERRIYLIRGEKVMLDYDLAALYGIETRALKQAVRRNYGRFPADFMFELSAKEISGLVSQNVIPGRGKFGGARPMAFTEQGVAMLSSVLRSKRAVQVNIAIMRTFVRLREMLLSNADLARKLDALEKKYDAQFKVVFDAIRELMTPPEPPRHQIGFHSHE
jgi:ORF6N domain